MIKEAAPAPVVEPTMADRQTQATTELVYTRADGTVEYAENAQDAISRCPVLGEIAINSPETANYLLELAAVGNAKLDEQKAEKASFKLYKKADSKPLEIQVKAEETPSSVAQSLHLENNQILEKPNELEKYTIDTVIVQKLTNDDFKEEPLKSKNFKDYIQVSKSLHTEKIEDELTALSQNLVTDDEAKLIDVTAERIDNLALSDESVYATEIIEVEHMEKLPNHSVSWEVFEEDTELMAQNESIEEQAEDTFQEFLDTTAILELTGRDDFGVEVSLDQPAEVNPENIIVLEEATSVLSAKTEPSVEVVEWFNIIAESANEEPLESTLEILVESIEQRLEAPEQIVLEVIMSKIAEIIDFKKDGSTQSAELTVILEEIVELMGYAKPEIIIEEYLQSHSTEQLHQVLSGLYKAYSKDEKKELFGKSFTNLQYLQDSKQKISKHIFTLIVQGRLFSAAAA